MIETIRVPYIWGSLIGKELSFDTRYWDCIEIIGVLKTVPVKAGVSGDCKYHLQLKSVGGCYLGTFIVEDAAGNHLYCESLNMIPEKIEVLGWTFEFCLVDDNGLPVLNAHLTNEELGPVILKIVNHVEEPPGDLLEFLGGKIIKNTEGRLVGALVRLLNSEGDRNSKLLELGAALNCKVINVKEEKLVGEGS